MIKFKWIRIMNHQLFCFYFYDFMCLWCHVLLHSIRVVNQSNQSQSSYVALYCIPKEHWILIVWFIKSNLTCMLLSESSHQIRCCNWANPSLRQRLNSEFTEFIEFTSEDWKPWDWYVWTVWTIWWLFLIIDYVGSCCILNFEFELEQNIIIILNFRI